MEKILELLILAVLGALGGVLAGIVGVGGGIVFVPALVYVAGWDIKEAVAASFVIIVFSSLSGTIRSARSEDPADWRAAALFAFGGAGRLRRGSFGPRLPYCSRQRCPLRE